MKPADFFIGVRQFFGVWIPGLVWVIAISLAVAERDPIENLDSYSWREIFAALIFAYLCALGIRGLSFRIGLIISYWLHEGISGFAGALRRRGGSNKFARLLRRIVQQPFGSALLASNPDGEGATIRAIAHNHLGRILSRAGVPEKELGMLAPSDLDEITQQSLLGADKLAQRTDDAQAELDLYASLLLPIAALVCALFIYWNQQPKVVSFFGDQYCGVWLVSLSLSFVGLACKIQLRRQSEQIDWYHMSLALIVVSDLASESVVATGNPAIPREGACPLCRSADVRAFAELRHGRYLRCGVCRLVFLHPALRPSAEAERAHYGTHENDPDDPGYRAFLARLADPLAERLSPRAEGLDYGSGPGPALPRMMEARGFRMRVYDPFFAPDDDALRGTYDFVACSETAEHFHHPADEFARLDGLLRPGGWLGVMTEMLDDARDFGTWRYARDPTHVCFYHADTMRWIADAHGWRMEAPARNVVLFHKPAAGASGE